MSSESHSNLTDCSEVETLQSGEEVATIAPSESRGRRENGEHGLDMGEKTEGPLRRRRCIILLVVVVCFLVISTAVITGVLLTVHSHGRQA